MSPHRLFCALFLFSGLLLALPGAASATNVFSVRIVGYGLYMVSGPAENAAGNAAIGLTAQGDEVSQVHNILRSEEIPAAEGAVFGVEFKVRGLPEGGRASVKVEMDHPRLENPATGAARSFATWQTPAVIGAVNWTGWMFTRQWEVVPGPWTIRLYVNGERVAEQEFSIRPSPLRSGSPLNLTVRIPREALQEAAAAPTQTPMEAAAKKAPAAAESRRPPEPARKPEAPAAPAGLEGKVYVVQVGAFAGPAHAGIMADRLEQAGYSPTILKLYDQQGKLYHTVYIAATPTYDQARAIARSYRQDTGADVFVRPMEPAVFEEASAR